MAHTIAIILVVVLATIVSYYMLRMSLSLTASMARVRRAGNQQAREFRRAGVTLPKFLKARVSRQDSSSLISTRAGVSLRSSRNGLSVRETRTIAKDVI